MVDCPVLSAVADSFSDGNDYDQASVFLLSENFHDSLIEPSDDDLEGDISQKIIVSVPEDDMSTTNDSVDLGDMTDDPTADCVDELKKLPTEDYDGEICPYAYTESELEQLKYIDEQLAALQTRLELLSIFPSPIASDYENLSPEEINERLAAIDEKIAKLCELSAIKDRLPERCLKGACSRTLNTKAESTRRDDREHNDNKDEIHEEVNSDMDKKSLVEDSIQVEEFKDVGPTDSISFSKTKESHKFDQQTDVTEFQKGILTFKLDLESDNEDITDDQDDEDDSKSQEHEDQYQECNGVVLKNFDEAQSVTIERKTISEGFDDEDDDENHNKDDDEDDDKDDDVNDDKDDDDDDVKDDEDDDVKDDEDDAKDDDVNDDEDMTVSHYSFLRSANDILKTFPKQLTKHTSSFNSHISEDEDENYGDKKQYFI